MSYAFFPRKVPFSVRQNLTVLTVLTALLLGESASIFAQAKLGYPAFSPPPVPYEDKAPPRSRLGRQREMPPPPKLHRKLTRAEQAQLARTRQTAMRLAEKSDETFRRGLMPLGDYLRQLSLSYTLKKSVADLGGGQTRRALSSQEVSRYQGIVQQLQQFRQPASEGWAGDLALAQTALSRVEAESAQLAGDQSAMTAALDRQLDWSQKHLQARTFDAYLGMAPPQSVIEAAQLERRSGLDAMPRNPTAEDYRGAFQAYRDQLKNMADQVERWSDRGSGLGRIDRVHQARFELAQTDAVLGILNRDESARRTALKTAETELTAMFQSQQEFHSKGTAGLFDMARTWSNRQSVYDQAADLKGFVSKETAQSHARDFAQLENIADQTVDRRGRIAADVQFISALKAQQELAALQNTLTDPTRAAGQ